MTAEAIEHMSTLRFATQASALPHSVNTYRCCVDTSGLKNMIYDGIHSLSNTVNKLRTLPSVATSSSYVR